MWFKVKEGTRRNAFKDSTFIQKAKKLCGYYILETTKKENTFAHFLDIFNQISLRILKIEEEFLDCKRRFRTSIWSQTYYKKHRKIFIPKNFR